MLILGILNNMVGFKSKLYEQQCVTPAFSDSAWINDATPFFFDYIIGAPSWNCPRQSKNIYALSF